MVSLFSRLKGKDGRGKKKGPDDANVAPALPAWTDAWSRDSVEPEEIQELVRKCTEEVKARALDHPFLLLPFRPTSNPSAVRTFIRHFFDPAHGLRGENLAQELRMSEPMVICGVLKWCWCRLQGGIIGWEAYELFKVGEQDSNFARDSFKTFIPLSVDNGARCCIIFDYFDLLSAIAAHAKLNGLGARKLPRLAAWWAFEHKDTKSGFDGGYKAWLKAADATTHLFFAYLRCIEQPKAAISLLPMSLQKLLKETDYPPRQPALSQHTHRVVMVVDAVSPTPFALLRRANHFEYREADELLHEYSNFDDPLEALTEECSRVLRAISAANQSQASNSKHSTGLRDASWSRFEDLGFSSALEEDADDSDSQPQPQQQPPQPQGLRSTPASGALDLGRPTTPSWADFLSSGFADDGSGTRGGLLPPDKVLPPIDSVRQRSAQSHYPRLEGDSGKLEPGELANITEFDLDDAFWWVWMTSLAPEETPERKSAFGRCAVIEVVILGGQWLVMEEMVVGAAPEPQEGTYVAEKRGFFSWRRRALGRRKSTSKSKVGGDDPNASKASVGPDQQARIQAAAAQLQARQRQEKALEDAQASPMRRGRTDQELMQEKTNSMMTLQPAVLKEASAALKWANMQDKAAVRDAYLANADAGRGHEVALPAAPLTPNSDKVAAHQQQQQQQQSPEVPPKDLPPPPPPAEDNSSLPTPPSAMSPPRPTSEWPEVSSPGRDSPLPDEGRVSMSSPDPYKGRRLPKDSKDKEPTGLRKLFSRRRGSKVPENAATDVNDFLRQQSAATPEPRAPDSQLQSPPAHASAAAAAAAAATAADRPYTPDVFSTPAPSTHTPVSPQSAARESFAAGTVSRPTTGGDMHDDYADADEGTPYAQFAQGPLEDQPAFVPESDDEDDSIIEDYDGEEEMAPAPMPQPVMRHRQGMPLETIPDEAPPAPAQTQTEDRWAQIRRNAAERAAAQRAAEERNGSSGRTTDDDASTEETLESRVARIKARVALLTNVEPGSEAPLPAPMANRGSSVRARVANMEGGRQIRPLRE